MTVANLTFFSLLNVFGEIMRTCNQLPKTPRVAGHSRRLRYHQFRLPSEEPAAHAGISFICLLTFLILVFLVLSCGKDQIVNPPAYTYWIPEETGDGWQTASLEEVGINRQTVSDAINRINYKLDEKDKITLEHLLTMSAGLQWDEWSYPYTDSRNSHFNMWF
jgi:hypothetical protein